MKNNETVIIAQCIHFISLYFKYSLLILIWILKCIHVKMNNCSTMNFESKRNKMCVMWY